MSIIKIPVKYFLSIVFLSVIINCKSENENSISTQSENVAGTLSVSADGVYMRNGKAYQGIGINYFNAFYRTILNNNDKSYTQGLKYLGDNKIPFIRFSSTGFWPNELKLYRDNKNLYFTLLDEFVRCAETNGVGLIPSLFWYYAAVPDLVGEHMNQWGNPNSKTIAFMRTYTADIVNRYKNSPAIWGWELGNEWNSYVDLQSQAINFLPKISVAQGTPASRTIEDAITTVILRTALNEFAAVVRTYDSYRPIFSGNGICRTNSYHLYKYATWTEDSSTEYTSLLDAYNPNALGTITVHLYPEHESKFFTDYNPRATLSQFLKETMRSAKELKKPLFLGEFGSPKTLGTTLEAQKFQELLSAVIDNKVQLSSLWVYDFTYQDADWNITQNNSRSYQLNSIINANAQFQISAGIETKMESVKKCSVFPNPVSDNFELKMNDSELNAGQNSDYQIFNLQGQLMKTGVLTSNATSISIADFEPSVYILSIKKGNEVYQTIKIVKD